MNIVRTRQSTIVSIGNHEKCIFQPPHNEMKRVLCIQKSYSKGKKGHKFPHSLMVRLVSVTPPYGQPDRKIPGGFLRLP